MNNTLDIIIEGSNRSFTVDFGHIPVAVTWDNIVGKPEGKVFGGVITPSTLAPTTPDEDVFFTAFTAGSYNFGFTLSDGYMAYVWWNGASWSSSIQEIGESLTFDDTPTEGSTNPVESGGVYDALGNLYNALAVAENCLFGGYVEPNDEPIYGDDHRYYYLAATEGRYTHFYNFVVDGYIAMFSWSESTQNWRMLSLWPNDQIVSRWLQSKANIVYNATDGNLASLTADGDLSDSGIASSEVAMQSDLSGFITNTVNNLTNYYLKSETYTQAEVNALIGAIQQFHYEIYATLPQTGQSNVLYLIGPTGSGSDKYEEYVYSNSAFTKIGDTSIDLSGYVTTSALNTALAAYTTTSDLTTLLSNKADKVSNANNGNFAGLDSNGNLTDSGYSSSDFATAAQGALADTAYQKPSTGIPASDLASGVIPDISGKEDTSNKVTSLSSSSTDTQYPSAKCVYDIVGNIETLLAAI